MQSNEHPVDRRGFLAAAGGVAAASALPGVRLWAQPAAGPTVSAAPTAETLVKELYNTLTPGQREAICFAWDYVEQQHPRPPRRGRQRRSRGLLRTHVSNNWQITPQTLDSDFFTSEQRAITRKIMEGIYSPEWIDRVDRQLGDDSGGWDSGSIAIFGEPSASADGAKFEFVMTGRHQTIRCDGNSAEHVAFGGPIFYGHDADGFYEGPTHPGNVYWPQALAANKLYEMLDGEQQQAALVRRGMPREQQVGFKGPGGPAEGKPYQGIPVAQLSADQQANLQGVLKTLLEPFRKVDRREVRDCMAKQGGLAACHLAYYQQVDIGKDGVWDNWRLEGPSFVWHYRGAPHVHVWVNVADDPGVKLNA